jgi:hypothetical protein
VTSGKKSKRPVSEEVLFAQIITSDFAKWKINQRHALSKYFKRSEPHKCGACGRFSSLNV